MKQSLRKKHNKVTTLMKRKLFPPLYSKNLDGSLQEWTIYVDGNIIKKMYGRMNGKMQCVSDIIASGKNVGKSNGTSPEEQAVAEATAQWEKKLKSGYVKTHGEAKLDKVDRQFITGGIEPMLAHKFRDHAHKIEYPCYSQPKLDGIRCIAIVKDGKCTLWSRTRKPILGVPHVIKAVELACKGKDDMILDGELYNHLYKSKFEEIVSFVRQETPKRGHEIVQYHVYDVIDPTKTFEERNTFLSSLHVHPTIVNVSTTKIADEDELMEQFSTDRKAGYEGSMARNADSYYEQKRSYSLQKIKEFDDAEFEVVAVEAGRGRMSECAIFCCVTKTGDNFNCKMEGSLEILKGFLKNPESVIGKMLTVRYQGLTNGNVPRFPIGVVVRNYE